MPNNQQSIFSLQCPSLSFAGPSSHSITPSLLPSSLMPAQTPAFGLGLDLKLPTPSFSQLTFTGVTAASVELKGVQVKDISDVSIPKHPSMGMVTGTVKHFAKDYIPKEAKSAGMVASAVTAGKKLSDRIQDSLDHGTPVAEAYACETARTLSEELSGKLIKGTIVGGIQPYLAAAVANPALAVSVPFVLPIVPEAYKGAQIASEVIGNSANKLCHDVFKSARELSQGPKL